MKLFKKLAAFLTLLATVAAFAVSVSAAETYSVEGITLSKGQYKAYEYAVSQAEESGMTVDRALFAKAAATVDYAGLQARHRTDGKTGIRSLYNVDHAYIPEIEAAGYQLSFGAIMGMAEYYDTSYPNTPDNMEITLDGDMIASPVATEKVAAVNVYATSGKQEGVFTNATKNCYAFTTTYGDGFENLFAYTQLGLVYRGFLALRDTSGNSVVFYYDGIGDTFGNDCMYGVGTSAMDVYSYYTTYGGYEADADMLAVVNCTTQTFYTSPDAEDGGKGTAAEPFALGEALAHIESVMANSSFDHKVDFEILLGEGKYVLTEEAAFDGSAFSNADYSISLVGEGDGKTVVTSAIDVSPVNGIYNLPSEYMTDDGYLTLRSMLADGKMMNMATSAEYVMQYDAAKFVNTTFNEGGKIASESGALVAEEDEVLYLDAALLSSLTSSRVDGTKHYIPGTEIWIKVEWQVQAVVLDYYDTAKTKLSPLRDGEEQVTLYAAHVRHADWARLLNTEGSSGRSYYSSLAERGYTLRNNAAFLTENTFTYDASSGQFQVATVDGVSYSVPVLTRLFAFENVKNVTVTGIDFTGTTDTFTSKYGYVTGQTGYQKLLPSEMEDDYSEFLPFAAVYGKHVENITVDGCSFYDIGCDAVQLSGTVNGASVTNNSFVDIASSAVRIGNNKKEDVYAKDLTITQNYIERSGILYPSSVAVAVYKVSDLKLNYNTLIDSAYSAISVGWSWAAYSKGVNVTNAEIAYNNIKGFMVSGMKDGGAIYVLGGNATAEEENLFNSMHHNYCEVTEDTSRAAGEESGTYTVLYYDGAASHWHTHHNVIYTLHETNPTKYSYISYQSIEGSQTYNCLSEYNYFINLDEEFRIFYRGLDKAELYNLRAENNILVEDAHEAYAMVEPHEIVTGAGCDGHKATYPVDCANGQHVYLRKEVLSNDANLAYPATTKTAAQYYALCIGCDEFLTGSDTHLLFANGEILSGDTHQCVYLPILDSAVLAAAATCASPASYYKTCVDCGEQGSETFTVGAVLPHTWDNSTKSCSVCGAAHTSNATVSENGREIVVTTAISETRTSLTVTVPADKIHYTGLYVVNFDWVLSDDQNYVEVISPNTFMMVNRDLGATGGSYSTYGFYVYLEARKNNDITVNILNGAQATACNKVRFRFIETIASSFDSGTNTPREFGGTEAAGITDATINVPVAGKYELVVFGGSPDDITMEISVNGGTATSLTERPTNTTYYYTASSKTYAKNYKYLGFIPMGDKPHTGTSGFYYMSLGSYNFNAGVNTVSVNVTDGRWCPSSKIGDPPTYIFLVSSDAETHTYTDWVPKTSQTCESGMTMTRTCSCSECNGKAETVTVPATGHDYGMWHDVFADSCLAGHIRYRACRTCSAIEYETIPPTAHDYGEWQNEILVDNVNLKSAATCTSPALYYKVCSACGVISFSETFAVGEPLGHVFAGEESNDGITVYRGCTNAGCTEKMPLASVPQAAVPDFFVEIPSFSGSFTVPADKIWESGFYWVTLTGTTNQTSNYTYMYNETAARVLLGEGATASEVEAYAKLIASRNRDRSDAAGNTTGSPDGFLYSVYLVAGMDNIVSYTGVTVTRARFSFAAPVDGDSIWLTSGKNDLVANTVTSAGFKDDRFYQMRNTSVLRYKKMLTFTEDSYYALSANIFATSGDGELTFTFTETRGGVYEFSISLSAIKAAVGDRTLYNGATEAIYFAPNLAILSLPAGEYTLTLSQTNGGGTMVGAILLCEMPHVCRPYVAYNVPPTCNAVGYTGEGCPICAKGATVLPATGHTAGGWIIDSDATCTEDGVKHKKCTVCRAVLETGVIPATGHTAGDWIIDSDATCTADGLKHKECTVCREVLETGAIPATGHTAGDWITDTEVTCIADGAKHKECTVCHEVLETVVVSATGHAWGDVEITTEATCGDDGLGTQTCGNCGATKDVVIEATGHEYGDDEECDYCGGVNLRDMEVDINEL